MTNGDASSLEAIKTTDEYKQIKAKLSDRDWRISNLYTIKSKDGLPIPFRPNAAQRSYAQKEWFRDTILKSRKLGFSTYIGICILDQCLFSSNNVADIIDRTQSDAESKLEAIKFSYDRLPAMIRNAVPLVKDNQSELVFENGSSIGAGTSSRGGTPQMLHVSEYGPISADNPNKAKEIKSGSFTAVPQSGKIWVESTAKGTAGEFFDLVKVGEKVSATGQRLTPLDFKLHFYNWTMDTDNRLPVNLVVISPALREYFDELRIKHGIILDGEQEAWYAKTHEMLGPDDMKQEHPSLPSECFFASLEGAYFKTEMNEARRDRRIGYPVPYDPSRPVHTGWDLGLDGALSVIFMQTDGVRHRFIDIAKGETAGLADGIKILKQKSEERGFRYMTHYGPHDLEAREWGAMPLGGNITAPTRKQMAAEHGIDFTVVPRVQDKSSSIEAARRLIGTSYFCSEHASYLVEALDSYTRRWNKTTAQWMGEPLKNGYDHTADAYQQISLGLKPDVAKRRDQVYGGRRKGSHWSA